MRFLRILYTVYFLVFERNGKKTVYFLDLLFYILRNRILSCSYCVVKRKIQILQRFKLRGLDQNRLNRPNIQRAVFADFEPTGQA